MAAADKPLLAKGKQVKNELIFVDYNIAKSLHDVAAEQVRAWCSHAVLWSRKGWRDECGEGRRRFLTRGCGVSVGELKPRLGSPKVHLGPLQQEQQGCCKDRLQYPIGNPAHLLEDCPTSSPTCSSPTRRVLLNTNSHFLSMMLTHHRHLSHTRSSLTVCLRYSSAGPCR